MVLYQPHHLLLSPSCLIGCWVITSRMTLLFAGLRWPQMTLPCLDRFFSFFFLFFMCYLSKTYLDIYMPKQYLYMIYHIYSVWSSSLPLYIKIQIFKSIHNYIFYFILSWFVISTTYMTFHVARKCGYNNNDYVITLSLQPIEFLHPNRQNKICHNHYLSQKVTFTFHWQST